MRLSKEVYKIEATELLWNTGSHRAVQIQNLKVFLSPHPLAGQLHRPLSTASAMETKIRRPIGNYRPVAITNTKGRRSPRKYNQEFSFRKFKIAKKRKKGKAVVA